MGRSKIEERWGQVEVKVKKQCVHFLFTLLQALDFHPSLTLVHIVLSLAKCVKTPPITIFSQTDRKHSL